MHVKKPDIAMIHYSGPPTVGGVQNVIAAQAKAFADAGYKVKVVVGQGGEFYEGVEVKVIPTMDPRHHDVAKLLKNMESGEPGEKFNQLKSHLAQELYEALSPCHIWIVHNIFTMDKNVILTAALCELVEMLKGVGFVAWTHDAVFLREDFQRRHPADSPPWGYLRHPLPGLSYVAVSSARAGEIMSRWGKEKVEVLAISNGISPADLLGISPEDYRVLEALGLMECFPAILIPVRVLERKNILLALRVVRALVDMGRDCRLIVTGPPGTHSPGHLNHFHNLKAEVSRLGIEGHVKFLYEFSDLRDSSLPLRVTDRLVAALYRASDILLMPSTEEGFGLPLMEAGMLKMPILCSDIGPFREIGGENVEFFPLNQDPRKVAEKVLALTEGTKTGRMFRSAIKEYRWEKIFQEQIEPMILKLWEEKKKTYGQIRAHKARADRPQP